MVLAMIRRSGRKKKFSKEKKKGRPSFQSSHSVLLMADKFKVMITHVYIHVSQTQMSDLKKYMKRSKNEFTGL